MADSLYINGVQVHPNITTYGGKLNVLGLDWGEPDMELFIEDVGLYHGQSYAGGYRKERKFTVELGVSEVTSLAMGQDIWEDVAEICELDSGLVAVKFVRENQSAATVTRVINALLARDPAWRWVKGGGGDGLRSNGNLRMTLPFIAPYPFFRPDTTAYSEATINTTGTTPANTVVTRGGSAVAVGVEIKISTTGTLASCTVSDGNRTFSLTATFNATPKGVDWHYTDPTATSIDTGVTITATSDASVHSSSTTFTFTPGGGSTGTHTCRIRWYPAYRNP